MLIIAKEVRSVVRNSWNHFFRYKEIAYNDWRPPSWTIAEGIVPISRLELTELWRNMTWVVWNGLGAGENMCWNGTLEIEHTTLEDWPSCQSGRGLYLSSGCHPNFCLHQDGHIVKKFRVNQPDLRVRPSGDRSYKDWRAVRFTILSGIVPVNWFWNKDLSGGRS